MTNTEALVSTRSPRRSGRTSSGWVLCRQIRRKGNEMKRFATLLGVMGLVFATMVPASAEHGGAIEGRWRAKDADGSHMMMTIEETDDDLGYFTVVFMDTRATVACDRPARFVAVSTTATYSDEDGRFFATFAPGRCFGNSEEQLGEFEIQFDPGPDGDFSNWDGTLIDWSEAGNVWYRVGG